jgi:UDP-N-acetylglucosamine 2-epimerase (non-hydrolysing)
VHPRTRQVLQKCALDLDASRILVTEPLGYLDFVALEEAAALVMTDSGGVQEETSVFGVPCLTLRENTERPITVTQGTNSLVGFSRDAIVSGAREALARGRSPSRIPLWDGHACERIAGVLTNTATVPRFVPPALAAAGSAEFLAGRSSTFAGGHPR